MTGDELISSAGALRRMRLLNTLFVALGVLFLGLAADADTTPPADCTPSPVTFNDGTGGPTVAACPPFKVPGATLIGVTLTFTADYQFGAAPGTNSVQVLFVPDGPVGVTWTRPTVILTTTGDRSSGPVPTSTSEATSGISAAAFAAPFNVNITSLVMMGSTATSSGAASVVYAYTPPPLLYTYVPAAPSCASAAATVAFPAGEVPENAFLIDYAPNLDKGDSLVDVTNVNGANGAPAQDPGAGSSTGSFCANVYTFTSEDEELLSCCSCLVTPNALASLSVNNDLLSSTLMPVKPASVIVRLVASVPGSTTLAGGMFAWGTSLQSLPATNATTATAVYGIAKGPFRPATMNAEQLARIAGRCASIAGVCRSCRTGALGAENASRR